MTADRQTWYERVPKVELHIHLEGSIPLDALWDLVCKYGGDTTAPDLAALQALFAYRDFDHFICTWMWKNRFLREYEDFTFIAEQVARELARQNIIYAEMFYSPPDFRTTCPDPQKLTAAIRAGFARVPHIEIALVADLVRTTPPANAMGLLELLAEVRDQGVIGIGIGGPEAEFPPEPFADVFAAARRLGFHTNAHAGEAAGAGSVWGALRALDAQRIGHATRAAEDPALIDFLAERRIPLEMCPLSNVRTGVVATLEQHPIRRYTDRGLLVTVNTDDPAMFGNSLAEEYCRLEQRLGFTRAETRALMLNAVRASWANDDRKQTLIDRLQTHPDWLEVE